MNAIRILTLLSLLLPFHAALAQVKSSDDLKAWVEAGHPVYNMHGEIKVTSYGKKENEAKEE